MEWLVQGWTSHGAAVQELKPQPREWLLGRFDAERSPAYPQRRGHSAGVRLDAGRSRRQISHDLVQLRLQRSHQ